LSEEDGNGDGDIYVSVATFSQFKEDNAALCKAYRNHVETKIEGVEKKIDDSEKSISSKIKLVGAITGFLVTFLTLINVYLSVVR